MNNINNIIKLKTPLDKTQLRDLRAGDEVLLSGTIYTARDAAHKRLTAAIDRNEPLPLNLRGQIIYYCGPTPAKENHAGVGSAGPTTSSRMDIYTPKLLRETGLCAMIGKGNRNAEVIRAMCETGAVYFAALGGCGALISSCIKSAKTICYEDLGPEAIYEFVVEDMPLIVAIDCEGNSLFVSGRQEYLSLR